MLIVVCGLPGSGKSFFARKLSERLDARYLNSDRAREAVEARGQYAFDDELAVYEQMAADAGSALRKGRDVVVDATFYRKEMRDIFSTLSRLLHQPDACIRIVCDEDLTRERLSRPRLDSRADFSIYKQVESQFEDLEDDHLVLESTRNNIEPMLQQGLRYITLHKKKTQDVDTAFHTAQPGRS